MIEGKDVTDYFTLYGGDPDEFMRKLPVRTIAKTKRRRRGM
jgi:hypothetical protein